MLLGRLGVEGNGSVVCDSKFVARGPGETTSTWHVGGTLTLMSHRPAERFGGSRLRLPLQGVKTCSTPISALYPCGHGNRVLMFLLIKLEDQYDCRTA